MFIDVDALSQLASSQHVPLADVVTVVEAALNDAYRKNASAVPGARVQIAVTKAGGDLTVLDADGADITPADFGRLVATTTRQAVTQWLRDLERIRKVGVWAGREGSLVTGTVRANSRNRNGETSVDLGAGVEAVLPSGEAVEGEALRHGDRVTALIVAVNADDRGAVKVTISRRQPALITQLFTAAVPELAAGAIEVVSVARDPGSRTKIAVRGADGVDARSAMIGVNADRIRQVTAAVAGEKIDVVNFHAELGDYAAAALTPAAVLAVDVTDPVRRQVTVTVAPDQLALAVGRGGANTRLAQRLTGAKITVTAPTQARVAGAPGSGRVAR